MPSYLPTEPGGARSGAAHCRLVLDPDVVAERLGDEMVIVHTRTNRIYELNRTATRVWELLADGAGRWEIEQALLREFEVAPEALAREFEALLASLRAEGLVDERDRD